MQFSLPFRGHRPAIEQRFAQFHAENPEVYAHFVTFALQAIARANARGRKRVSADSIMHRVRWEIDGTWAKSDGFKVNNDFVSRYARLFITHHPEHATFFETRQLKSA